MGSWYRRSDLVCLRRKCPWRNVLKDKESWKTQVAFLKKAPPTSVEALIAVTITWDPKDRITAQQVLEHQCFHECRDLYKIEEEGNSGKRKQGL